MRGMHYKTFKENYNRNFLYTKSRNRTSPLLRNFFTQEVIEKGSSIKNVDIDGGGGPNVQITK